MENCQVKNQAGDPHFFYNTNQRRQSEPGLPRLTKIPTIFLSGKSRIIWKIMVQKPWRKKSEPLIVMMK